MQAAPCVSSIPRNSTLSLDYVVKRCTARRACCRLLQYVVTVVWVLDQCCLLEEVQLLHGNVAVRLRTAAKLDTCELA